MTRTLILALLQLAPVVAPAVAAPSKCQDAMKQAFECHQACQDSHSDAPGLKQCENQCPSPLKGCSGESDKAPAK